jgi:glycosyltransferase involved in cell wall biosynthesis
MTSIIIAAHNESAVLGRCLDAILADVAPGEFDVTVVANGCTDETAQVAAARPGVRVLDLTVAGKPAALNAGDAAAIGFPRIYLDADIVIGTDGMRALRDAVAVSSTAPGAVLAAAPRRELDAAGSSLFVRAFFTINARLPAFKSALFGRGVVALSMAGRARFDQFPDLVADDLFLDSLFTAAEKREVSSVSARIAVPRRTGDLLRRLVRVRRGNTKLRAAESGLSASTDVRQAVYTSWLRDVALHHPTLIPAAACYVAITVTAAVLASFPQRAGNGWGRDESSRQHDRQDDDVETADGRT